MANNNTHNLDMLNGRLLPKLISFAAPLALSGLLQLAFNAADVIVVGRFVGPQALAAVGSTGSLINLVVNFFLGLSVGVNVVASRNFGARNEKAVSETVHTAVLFAIVCGLFLVFLGEFAARPLLVFMDSPEDVLPLSLVYLRYYFACIPFSMLYNFGSAILRSVGDTKRPFYYLTAAGILNVFLNLFFVLVFDMGVAGVALATGISNALSAILVLWALTKEKGCLHLSLHDLKIHWAAARQIVTIGFPAGLQSVFFNISNVLIQSSVNSFGSLVMAGNAAAQNVEGFYSTCYSSISSAAITFTSANLGAGKFSRIDRVRRTCMLADLGLCGCLSGIYLLFGRTFLQLYSTDPEVIEIAMSRMMVFIIGYFTGSWMDVMSSMLRGLGKSILPMIVTLCGTVVFRIIWIYTVFAATRSYTLLIWGYPISWTLSVAADLVCYGLVMKKLPKSDREVVIG